MNRLGNNSPGKRSVGTGSGVPHRRLPFGHLTISGQAGEKIRISADELFNGVNVGVVLIQTTGGVINVFRTLADVDIAANPQQDTGGHWVQEKASMGAGSIQELGMGSCYMIEFVSNAVVYMSGV